MNEPEPMIPLKIFQVAQLAISETRTLAVLLLKLLSGELCVPATTAAATLSASARTPAAAAGA